MTEINSTPEDNPLRHMIEINPPSDDDLLKHILPVSRHDVILTSEDGGPAADFKIVEMHAAYGDTPQVNKTLPVHDSPLPGGSFVGAEHQGQNTVRPEPQASLEHMHAGTPLAERTPVATLHAVLRHPRAAEMDRRIAEYDAALSDGKSFRDLDERAQAMNERVQYHKQLLATVASSYGVPLREVHFIAPDMNDVWLPYKDNYAHLSIIENQLNVHAWDGQLSRQECLDAWDRHHEIIKAGTPLDHLRYYEQQGNIPPYLHDLRKKILQDGGDVMTAFGAHAAEVRKHAEDNGFRDFQIHAPHGNLRLALPLAFHLLELPTAKAYDIIGDYSITRGFLETREPGVFTMARQTDGPSWQVTPRGAIRMIRET